MSCAETISTYALRSLGIGERLLPRSDITLCEQFTLIGSGMLWNIYFGLSVVLADGVRDQDEDALLRLVANLLGVKDQDSALARQRVEAGL